MRALRDRAATLGAEDMPVRTAPIVSFLLLLTATGCATAPGGAARPKWAIAIHGGAGTINPNAPADRLQAYRDGMGEALTIGRDLLADGASALDVCEAVVRWLEDNPLFNAGRGAVFNEQGEHELDASIMDGATMQCGAVAGVRTVRHPITLARKVMTDTRHVLLAADGAERFADVAGVARVENSWFDTDGRRRSLRRLLRDRQRTGSLVPTDRRHDYGTVGCVVLDGQGRLAAATSTGGMTGKRWGRVGDAPIVGAGTYADAWGAVSCTGTGEEFIRHGVARSVTARMALAGQDLDAAAHAVVHDVLAKGDGGLIAVDRDGNLTAPFNTTGMYRAMADSRGRFEVAIFHED